MSDDTERRTSADIAREAEQRRADLGRTLDELRQKMMPGGIADDLWNSHQETAVVISYEISAGACVTIPCRSP